WSIKDPRPKRPRTAKAHREEYLRRRSAAFLEEDKKAKELGLDWVIKSSIVLERLPVIMPEFTDWQKDMWELQAQQSFYGREYPPELGIMDNDVPLLTMDQLMEQSNIPVAPRRTPADEEDDRTSLNRALEHRLILIVKEGAESPWHLPESAWKAGETIRQAAERTARQLLRRTAIVFGQPDNVAQLHFVGNCPAGWLWRTLGKDERNRCGHYGEKVFFNRVQLITGKPDLRKTSTQFLWVTKHEIGEYLGSDAGTYFSHMI
ncbi:unnamed protein product, partial [Choristocarpus tenellus]